MDIRILPSHVANMIAAGEVVQRPASVVKELMENSLDAGASRVQVVVTDAGRTLIQVIDNGCGMNPDDAVVCFQRHATSKIASAEDLDSIRTFGFRGEALPSIAAVSEVTLKTRTADDDLATQVTVEGATALEPGHQDVIRTASPLGTSVAVRNIFYNTPARRKFLRSDASEMKAITAEFTRVALTRKDVSFSLSSNGRDVMVLHPAQSFKYRIRDIFGEQSSSELIDMDARSQYVTMSGYLSDPRSARKTTSNQFFFVNGRFFRSPYLHKAVMKAYENLLPEGCAPSYYIYVEIDPSMVDVNVHPTKTEIKFEDDNILFAMLNAAVKEALARSSFGEGLDFDAGNLPQLHNVGQSFEEYKGPAAPPSFSSDPQYNPFDGDGFPNEQWYDRKPSLQRQDCSRLFDSVPMPSEAASGMTSQKERRVLICGHFLLTPSPSGLLLVDVRRASQRMFYDHFLECLEKGGAQAQGQLFSIEVEIGPENMPVVASNDVLLRSMGFSLSPVGAGTVRVDAVPDGLVDDGMSISAFIYETVNALSSEQTSLSTSLYSPLAEKLAESAARGAVCPTDEAGARTFLDRLFSCDNPDFTSDGRRIVAILTNKNFEDFIK